MVARTAYRIVKRTNRAARAPRGVLVCHGFQAKMLATTPGQRLVADVRMLLLGALLFSKEMMVVLAIEPSMATYGLARVQTRPAAECGR